MTFDMSAQQCRKCGAVWWEHELTRARDERTAMGERLAASVGGHVACTAKLCVARERVAKLETALREPTRRQHEEQHNHN